MLSIYNDNLEDYAKEHYDELRSWLQKRVKNYLPDDVNLYSDLEKIITSNLSELLSLNSDYNKKYPYYSETKTTKAGKTYTKFVPNKIISGIFNYKEFRKKHGYTLANKLGITCCPYCNKNYTTSHDTKKKDGDRKNVFPEFDHFYPKSKYPLLAISFYNLIPSCSICNTHFKQEKDPFDENLFYPYTKLSKGDGIKFKFYSQDYKSLIGQQKNTVLDFEFTGDENLRGQLKNSINFFGIKDNYEKAHSDLISDIIDKRITYSAKYLDSIKDTYKLDFESSYRILFETHYEDENLHKRPFAKLKKDIYDDFEICKYL
jgi:hypothetical protein